MLQDHLNNIAILHIYYDMTKKLDLDELIDEFISKNSKRIATFALIWSIKSSSISPRL